MIPSARQQRWTYRRTEWPDIFWDGKGKGIIQNRQIIARKSVMYAV
ncbi:MAG: hypothetical protein K0R82_1494 [Flavipsychrobacter sp.]|jgi:hypothetical protein|nr:hypothetical protein [Flavipsychrobacter sp.]